MKKGLVLELLQIQKSSAAPWSQFTLWIEKLFQVEDVSINALSKAVTDLYSKKLKIRI